MKSSIQENMCNFYHTICFINDHFRIMIKRSGDDTVILPYYVYTVRFIFTRQNQYTHKFNIEITDIKQLHSIGERLRFLRYQNNLLQSDVATVLGIKPSSYIRYENESKPQYSTIDLVKLSSFYKVDIEDIMDDYHLFLYNGQGKQVKALREKTGMSRYAFEKAFGFPENTVQKWENESRVVSKKSYLKLKHIYYMYKKSAQE